MVEACIWESNVYGCRSSWAITQEKRDASILFLQDVVENLTNKVSVNRRVVDEAESVFEIGANFLW